MNEKTQISYADYQDVSDELQITWDQITERAYKTFRSMTYDNLYTMHNHNIHSCRINFPHSPELAASLIECARRGFFDYPK